jgi:hypothetical protein
MTTSLTVSSMNWASKTDELQIQILKFMYKAYIHEIQQIIKH